MAVEEMPSFRRWMGLPPVTPSDSAMDRVYASLYGVDNYDRPWDEAEARGLTSQQLTQELLECALVYDVTNDFNNCQLEELDVFLNSGGYQLISARKECSTTVNTGQPSIASDRQ